jgi:hypothetical protein
MRTLSTSPIAFIGRTRRPNGISDGFPAMTGGEVARGVVVIA